MSTHTTRTASAPGKVIVSGEHAVVYGYPALLAATDLRLEWTVESPEGTLARLQKTLLQKHSLQEIFDALQQAKEVQVSLQSDIPIGSGLGSSAAFSVSLASLILPATASLAEINALAYQFETIQHGKPSGGDNTVSCYGGVLWYRKESEQCKLFQSLTPQRPFPELWLIDSGIPAESTKELVAMVGEKRKSKTAQFDNAFREMERVARGWLAYLLENASVDAVDLLRENHRALVRIGVVSSSTKRLIAEIESLGGAAKITGAGGVRAGSGMIVVYHEDSEKLRAWAREKQLDLLPVHLGGPGVELKGKNL